MCQSINENNNIFQENDSDSDDTNNSMDDMIMSSKYQYIDEYEEYEDRIYSRNKVIPNARGYIKRMDLDVSRECPRQELDGGFNPKVLIEIATGAGVPTFIFPSRYKWGQQSGGIQIKNVQEYENLQIDYNTGLFVPVTVKQGKI